jgi:ABC-type multidrug transport system fused ATPase/permease subunit
MDRYKYVFSAKVIAMKMTNVQLYLRLLNYVKPYWRVFATSLIATAIVASTEALVPALLKPMLDGTFVHKDQSMMRMVFCSRRGYFCQRLCE